MTGTFRAFLDASVIYPASLRDLLMRLTMARLFQARWSSHVHEEWIRAVLRDRSDLSVVQLDSVRAAMDSHAEDCLVTGYESLIGSLTLPDPTTAMCWPPRSSPERMSSSHTIYGIFPTKLSTAMRSKRSTPMNLSVTSST
jgi:hypothetical protein